MPLAHLGISTPGHRQSWQGRLGHRNQDRDRLVPGVDGGTKRDHRRFRVGRRRTALRRAPIRGRTLQSTVAASFAVAVKISASGGARKSARDAELVRSKYPLPTFVSAWTRLTRKPSQPGKDKLRQTVAVEIGDDGSARIDHERSRSGKVSCASRPCCATWSSFATADPGRRRHQGPRW